MNGFKIMRANQSKIEQNKKRSSGNLEETTEIYFPPCFPRVAEVGEIQAEELLTSLYYSDR